MPVLTCRHLLLDCVARAQMADPVNRRASDTKIAAPERCQFDSTAPLAAHARPQLTAKLSAGLSIALIASRLARD